MTTKNQFICLWAGYSFLYIYMLGFVLLAGFIPPFSPDLPYEKLSGVFATENMTILVGMSVCVVASALFILWTVAIFGQMLRVESSRFPALSYVQLVAGGLGAVFLCCLLCFGWPSHIETEDRSKVY